MDPSQASCGRRGPDYIPSFKKFHLPDDAGKEVAWNTFLTRYTTGQQAGVRVYGRDEGYELGLSWYPTGWWRQFGGAVQVAGGVTVNDRIEGGRAEVKVYSQGLAGLLPTGLFPILNLSPFVGAGVALNHQTRLSGEASAGLEIARMSFGGWVLAVEGEAGRLQVDVESRQTSWHWGPFIGGFIGRSF
ncbi:MAG: hypothetical protein HYY44_00890 [Deltaproteobacteria bacterium]|nr:hypothetical protein [Deltaproteobacteria bacterium]